MHGGGRWQFQLAQWWPTTCLVSPGKHEQGHHVNQAYIFRTLFVLYLANRNQVTGVRQPLVAALQVMAVSAGAAMYRCPTRDNGGEMSVASTRGIRVEVVSRYIPERSFPPVQWFFAYRVTIANDSDETVTLRARKWVITNADGKVQEVQGPGVVGEQPIMAPGERFQYVSACPLDTPVGTMHGSYQMETENGEQFDAAIAAFTLAEPLSVN